MGQLDERSLGLYAQSNRLMMYPARLIAAVTADVLLTGFAKLQHNLARLRTSFTDVVVSVSALLIPTLGTAAVMAGPFARGVLGPKWVDAAVLMSILAPTWALGTITRMPGALLQALGRADLMFRWGLISTVVTVGGYLAGARWGATGVAVGFLVTTVVLTPPNMIAACRLIDLRARDLVRAVLPFLAAGTVMLGLELATLELGTRRGWNDLAILFGGSALGALVYLGLSWKLAPVRVGRLLHRRTRTVVITVDPGTNTTPA